MDEEFEYEEIMSRRFRKADLAVLALNLVSDVIGAVHQTAMTAYNLAAAHANYCVDRDNFHEDAALAIETIVNGETDG